MLKSASQYTDQMVKPAMQMIYQIQMRCLIRSVNQGLWAELMDKIKLQPALWISKCGGKQRGSHHTPYACVSPGLVAYNNF